MPVDLPLGSEESSGLEFKGSDVLDRPRSVAREVVALLNGEGGTIWIGIIEERGRAVAIEPVDRPEERKERLLDTLVDSVEPPPRGEVGVEVVALDEGGRVLKVDVAPVTRRRPYALTQGGGRHYVVRVGARTRYMTREEIADEFTGTTRNSEDRLAEALSELTEERRALEDSGYEGLWLQVLPVRRMDLDADADEYRELFKQAARSGNRRSGWNAIDPYHEPELRQKLLVQGGMSLREDGRLELKIPLAELHWKGPEHEIYPYTLAEYVVSLFRIARIVYDEEPQGQDEVLADLGLFGVRGWTLRPYSPSAVGYMTRDPEPYDVSDDLVVLDPYLFSVAEILEEPDRCGFRMLREIYQGFGYGEEMLPVEFDRRSGRLEFRE